MNNLSEFDLKSLPGEDDIHRKVLSNGIVVLVRENKVSPSVVIKGYLKSGSLYDPNDKLGLSLFTALSLMRGTNNRSFQEIYNSLESIGAALGFSSGVHSTTFGGRALVEDFSIILEILSDCLRNPNFPKEQIERLRGQWLTRLAIRAQDTSEMASMVFDEILFPDHPYGRPEEGFIETIKNISLEDLSKFHKKYYGPETLVIVVSGGIEPLNAFNLIEKYLGDWNNTNEIEREINVDFSKLNEKIYRHVEIPGKSQSSLLIGTYGPVRKSQEYLIASLGNSVLGQFGMMGRIGEAVREKEGLAYYAASSVNSWVMSGSWEVMAGVNPKNIEKARDIIINELERFINEPVSNEELNDSKANFIGRLPLSLESNDGVASVILNMERYQLGLDYIRSYPARINAIQSEDILEVAKKYIDLNALLIVSAG